MLWQEARSKPIYSESFLSALKHFQERHLEVQEKKNQRLVIIESLFFKKWFCHLFMPTLLAVSSAEELSMSKSDFFTTTMSNQLLKTVS